MESLQKLKDEHEAVKKNLTGKSVQHFKMCHILD